MTAVTETPASKAARKAIIELLCLRREELGLSRRALMDRMGLPANSQSNLAMLETGDRAVSYDKLQQWADALDMDLVLVERKGKARRW